MSKPTIICLTPVKNEAWILDKFIRCASRWADHIIIADQGSDDGSRQIAAAHEKVRLIDNTAQRFNEPQRQKLLIDEARKIDGPRVLIALDADEFFTADFIESEEWRRAIASPPGTVLQFQWACVLPGCENYYVYPANFPLGFVDDGSPHRGEVIHSPRVPVPDEAPRLSLGVRVLHFSVADPHRFASKTRWYQCWEYLNKPERRQRPMELYRFYHRETYIAPHRVKPMPEPWTRGYGQQIDLLHIPTQDYYRWDREMLDMLLEHGPEQFARVDIWDVDWNRMHRLIHGKDPPEPIRDPRGLAERWVHRWLARTQPYYCAQPPPRSRLRRRVHNRLCKLIRKMGW